METTILFQYETFVVTRRRDHTDPEPGQRKLISELFTSEEETPAMSVSMLHRPDGWWELDATIGNQPPVPPRVYASAQDARDDLDHMDREMTHILALTTKEYAGVMRLLRALGIK